MPYVTRAGNSLTIDCACRPPGMSRELEVALFKTEIAEGDHITVNNAHSLPVQCWANIGTFAALLDVWQQSGAAEFTCLRPPRLLFCVFETLGLRYKTKDAPALTSTAP